MKIHHLDCGSMCPLSIGRMVCHCLLLETRTGLILVETGIGTADVHDPVGAFGRSWVWMARPRLAQTATALSQVKALGFARDDVRHIMATHLDLDHAGGLPDFPNATVHVHQRELDAATARTTARARWRYRTAHLAHGPRWHAHQVFGERWFGFEAVHAVHGSDGEVLLVPLAGHTEGHCAVAVKDGERWLMHCGDAYFHHNTLEGRRVPLAMALFERRVTTHRATQRANSARLAEFSRNQDGTVVIFNSHDAVHFERARRSTEAGQHAG